MDARIWDIVSALDESGCLTANELAARLDISSKTVRSLVKGHQREMQEAGFTITAKPGLGLVLTVLEPEVFARRQPHGLAKAPRDAEERAAQLMDYLLQQSDYIKLDDLSEVFYISRRTLSNDIREIERRLHGYGLQIERKPGYGIRVCGEETQYRICIASQFIQEKGRRNATFETTRLRAEQVIRQVLEAENFRLSLLSLEGLTVHITVAIYRIQAGCPIQSVSGVPLEIQSGILDVAKHLAGELEETFQVCFSLPEVYYIALHLTGKQIYGTTNVTDNLVIPEEIHQIATDMIDHVYEALRVDFRDNLELRMGLCMHLVPLAARLKSGLCMRNPILQDIKVQYLLAYEMATIACSVLERAYAAAVREDEIGYIAIHFALALERQTTHSVRKNILIVCGSGKGSAQLLAYRYQKQFAQNIGTIQTCDVLGLNKVDFSKIDYVFSTVPIPVPIPAPIHQIQYFPDEKDISRVKQLLQDRPSMMECYFSEELFLPHLQCSTREETLRQMCRFVEERKGLPPQFLELVRKRERLAATSFGKSVAMPHPWKAIGSETFVCIGILDRPVQWGEEQVQLVLLVSIANDTTENLQQFYQVSIRFLTDEVCIRQLIADRSFHTFLNIIKQKEQELEAESNG